MSLVKAKAQRNRSNASWRRAAGGLTACAVALSLAGCFGSSSSSSGLPGADPASVLPAATLAYYQQVVRPTGSLASGIDAASKRLLGIADPGAKIDAAIDKAVPAGVSYEKDIRPWLGARAGFGVISVSGGNTEYALVLDQTDTAKAQAAASNKALFANKGAAPDTITTGSYRGVSYSNDQTSKAIFGVVGQYFVIANNTAAFDATVDVDKGSSSLASVGSYQQALGGELSDAAGMVYLPLRRLIDLIPKSSITGSSSQIFSTLESKIGNSVFYGSARFDASGALVDLAGLDLPKSSSSTSSGSGASSSSETNPIGSLPADSWLAIGATNVGPALLKAFVSLEKPVGLSAASLSQSLAELRLATGLDVNGDLNSITTASFFVAGASTASLRAALLLGLSDPSKAQTIVSQLYKVATLIGGTQKGIAIGALSSGSTSSFTLTISGLPFPIVIAGADGKVIVAAGQNSLSAALATGPSLASTPGFKSAGPLLGNGIQPVTYLDLSKIGTLIQSASPGTSATVLSYLERLGSLAIGGGMVNGSQHVRIALTGS